MRMSKVIYVDYDEVWPEFHFVMESTWRLTVGTMVTDEWLENAKRIQREYQNLQDELREMSGFDSH